MFPHQTFVLVRLIPGDPARVFLGTKATPEAIANIRSQFGLDQPIWQQYFYFIKNLMHGEMGRSITFKIDVLQLIANRIEPTLALVFLSVLLSVLIAVPLAAVAARNEGQLIDHTVRVVSLSGRLPSFWLALMPILLFSVSIPLLPVSGYGNTLSDKLTHLVLPSLTIALSLVHIAMRSLRASMIDWLKSDVATASPSPGMPSMSFFFWRHGRGRMPWFRRSNLLGRQYAAG